MFIEPRELVDLNNAIKVADREIDREVRGFSRPLRGWSPHKPIVIAAGLDSLGGARRNRRARLFWNATAVASGRLERRRADPP